MNGNVFAKARCSCSGVRYEETSLRVYRDSRLIWSCHCPCTSKMSFCHTGRYFPVRTIRHRIKLKSLA